MQGFMEFIKDYIWIILAVIAGIVFYIVMSYRRMKPLINSMKANAELEEKYGEMTVEKIDAAPDDILWKAVLMGIWSRMADDMSDEKAVFASLNDYQKTVYAINKIETEVADRGLKTFYLTSHRMYALDSDFYSNVGAKAKSEIIKKANAVFEEHRDLFEKGELLPMSEQYYFDDVQNEWNGCDEDINALCVRYIREHKAEMAER